MTPTYTGPWGDRVFMFSDLSLSAGRGASWRQDRGPCSGGPCQAGLALPLQAPLWLAGPAAQSARPLPPGQLLLFQAVREAFPVHWVQTGPPRL